MPKPPKQPPGKEPALDLEPPPPPPKTDDPSKKTGMKDGMLQPPKSGD